MTQRWLLVSPAMTELARYAAFLRDGYTAAPWWSELGSPVAPSMDRDSRLTTSSGLIDPIQPTCDSCVMAVTRRVAVASGRMTKFELDGIAGGRSSWETSSGLRDLSDG